MMDFAGSGRKVIIEPQLPYMYIPKRDFKTFTKEFEHLFGDRKVKCDVNKGTCYWLKSCDRVRYGYTTHGGEKTY